MIKRANGGNLLDVLALGEGHVHPLQPSFLWLRLRLCMGACGHGQEGALAPSGNVVKCFMH